MQGGVLYALFCPSAKATFSILFCFFLFPLYIITKAKFIYFVTITSLPQTEMHLNNPCESAAKLLCEWAGRGCWWRRAARTPSQGCYTLSSYSARLSLLTVGHDLPPGRWLLASSKQGSGKEALWLLDPIHGLDPCRHHHPPETVYLFHVLYWPYGKSCKYCLLCLLKLRRNGNVVLVHSRLNSFERKTKHVLPPFIRSFLQRVWRALYFAEIWKGKGLWSMALLTWNAHILHLPQSSRSDVW